MTVNTRVIRILLNSNRHPWVEVRGGLRIQVLPNISYLARCQKHQSAAFIADRGFLVVWDDDPKKIMSRVEKLETLLMKTIWSGESAYPTEDEKEVVATDLYDVDLEDPESEKPRNIVLIQPILCACTIILCMAALGGGWRQVAIELHIDRGWVRIAFALCYLPQAWLALVNTTRQAY